MLQNKFKLFPADKVVVTYLVITALLTLMVPEKDFNPGIRILAKIVLTAVIFLIVFSDSKYRSGVTTFLHIFYPLALLGYLYGETALLNHIFFPADLDSFFINLDERIFGFQPAVEFSKAFPQIWFSELMNLGYFSYYFMTIGVSLAIYFMNRNFAEQTVFVIISSFLIYYLIFIIFPVVGPQFYFKPPLSDVPVTGFFSKAVKAVQEVGEHPTGAFPSSHVGMALIFLWISRKSSKVMFWILVPFVTLILFATVYIKAHYAVDVIGGIISVPVILYLCLWIWNKMKAVDFVP